MNDEQADGNRGKREGGQCTCFTSDSALRRLWSRAPLNFRLPSRKRFKDKTGGEAHLDMYTITESVSKLTAVAELFLLRILTLSFLAFFE